MAITKIIKNSEPTASVYGNVVSVVLLGALVAELAVGYLQLFHLYPSLHSLYRATGTFYNPGPYCCFLGMLLPVPFSLIIGRPRWRWLYWTAAAVFFATIAMMPLLQGRAGWLAGAAGCATVYAMNRPAGPSRRLVVCMAALAVAATGLLYLIRPASAMGRVLLWRVGWDAMWNNPGGVGWSRVAGALGEAQEQYFHDNPSSMFADVAGAPDYAFNEYLQTGIAFGVIGLAGFVLALFFSLYCATRKKLPGLAGAIVAAAVVCLFSYPLQFNAFTVTLGFVCVAALVAPPRIGPWLSLPLACAVTIAVATVSATAWNRNDINNNPKKLLFERGKTLRERGQLALSTEVLQEGVEISSDPMFLNLIGRN